MEETYHFLNVRQRFVQLFTQWLPYIVSMSVVRICHPLNPGIIPIGVAHLRQNSLMPLPTCIG